MTAAVEALYGTILDRQRSMPEGSYTAQLLRQGENEILKKIGEEAIEVLIAAKSEGDQRVVYEMADLVYHCLVLLAARGLAWSDIEAELEHRFR